MSQKRKSLDLKTKADILKEVDKGQQTKTKIAEKFGISKSTLSTILGNREKIDRTLASDVGSSSAKKIRGASHGDLENDLLQWFKEVRAAGVPLTGPLIQEKARHIASNKGIKDFECSSGWLWRFQKRHGITSLVVCGESKKVDELNINTWLNYFLPEKVAYAPRDVFNMDETGVFYNLLPDRTLDFKGQKCHGGARSKERLTIVLCCNADGSEKMKAWVIGKSANPRCLKNMNRQLLPCTYTNHNAAWIDGLAFREWIVKFDRRMAVENRHILLTLDNASAHNIGNIGLSNVKVIFFPPNATSRVQPLDQGIIANFKKFYRVRLIRAMIQSVENKEVKPKWNVLQAMRAVASSWSNVTAETIKNCFIKAWSPSKDATETPTESLEDVNLIDEPDEWSAVVKQISPACSFEDYVAVDDMILTSKLDHLENPSAEDICTQPLSDEEAEEEEVLAPSRDEVIKSLDVLQRFSETFNVSQMFVDNLERVSFECTQLLKPNLKQTNIRDYFVT